MKEIEEYLDNSYTKKKESVLDEITQYFNYNYPNVKVSYSEGEFKVEGTDVKLMELCKQDIESLLNFAKK
jgi:hypothetical protein